MPNKMQIVNEKFVFLPALTPIGAPLPLAPGVALVQDRVVLAERTVKLLVHDLRPVRKGALAGKAATIRDV